MNNFFFGAVVAAAALTFVPSTASAIVVDFTATGPDQTVIDFGDFTVSASSTGFVNFGPTVVNQTANGLGVDAGFIDSQGSQVDGTGGTETLTFVFDSPVTLTTIDFSAFNAIGGFFNAPDTYNLSFDGGAATNLNDDPWIGSQTLNSFALTATGFADWTVSSISYDAISVVPLPAGGLLFLSGLAGLGLARRLKRTA